MKLNFYQTKNLVPEDIFQIADSLKVDLLQKDFVWHDQLLEYTFNDMRLNAKHNVKITSTPMLIKACKSSKANASIIDLCSGFGKDLKLIRKYFNRVSACELDRVLALLNLSALINEQADLDFYVEDGFSVLKSKKFDVIYLDPMFTQISKKSLPNKYMQFARSRAASIDLSKLLKASLAAANEKVVVKFHSKFVPEIAPDWLYRGKLVSYGVYQTAPGVAATQK